MNEELKAKIELEHILDYIFPKFLADRGASVETKTAVINFMANFIESAQSKDPDVKPPVIRIELKSVEEPGSEAVGVESVEGPARRRVYQSGKAPLQTNNDQLLTNATIAKVSHLLQENISRTLVIRGGDKIGITYYVHTEPTEVCLVRYEHDNELVYIDADYFFEYFDIDESGTPEAAEKFMAFCKRIIDQGCCLGIQKVNMLKNTMLPCGETDAFVFDVSKLKLS